MTFLASVTGSGLRAGVVALRSVPASWTSAWTALANDAAEPNAFAEGWFVAASVAHLPLPDDARMLWVAEGSELIGLLSICTASPYGRTPLRHATNWLHYHSFYGAPLIRRGSEFPFWRAALDLLDRADWAPNFLHLTALDRDGTTLAGLEAARRADIVHSSERALLKSNLSASDYYETHVRKKKRKEIGRLVTRLSELGTLAYHHLDADADALPWIEDFLALEASGWKGREGSALGADLATRGFFHAAIEGAHAAGRLDMLRLTVNGRAIAMLVNFMTPPGSYSFKIAFDEDYARFSPGVLIQIENFKVLERADIAWMDSCAVEDHPMINSLWAERRTIVRVTVPLRGKRRRAAFAVARTLETASATVRRWR
jgi:CelD/BcsL family acetyltransferase involved in cellulose biosynthesis